MKLERITIQSGGTGHDTKIFLRDGNECLLPITKIKWEVEAGEAATAELTTCLVGVAIKANATVRDEISDQVRRVVEEMASLCALGHNPEVWEQLEATKVEINNLNRLWEDTLAKLARPPDDEPS